MEENQTEPSVSSPEPAEIKSTSQSTTTQNSGAIPKVITKSKPGGVKLGSFRIGGRKKNTEGDSNTEMMEEKSKSKKYKKEKISGVNKSESEDSAASTPSPGTRHSIPSKASSFVRRLSIVKYKSAGPGKTLKSPDTPSSQEYHSASTEEESFSTASPFSATEVCPNPEAVVKSMPTEDEAGSVDRWAADAKASNDSACNNGESLTLTMFGTKDASLIITSQNEISKVVDEESTIENQVPSPVPGDHCDVNNMEKNRQVPSAVANGVVILPTHFCKPLVYPPPCTLPPTEEENVSKHELWFTEEYDEVTGLPIEDLDEKRQRAKNKILLATTPMVEKYRPQVEEYLNKLDSGTLYFEKPFIEMPDLLERFDEPSEEPEPMLKKRKQTPDMPCASDDSLYLKWRLSQQNAEKREHLYKILVIGELGTGKTSIIKRYVHQFFSQHYRATIGVDFALKVLNWDQDTVIRLQLWDIAGQERFGNMTRVYYKEAVGAFIVFDVTRAATFDAVVKWKQDLDSKVQLPDGSPIPCVLLANKCDQPKEGLVNSPARMDEYCKERGFTAWFETSAKENINIEDAAKCLVTKILQNDKMIHNNESPKDVERFTLDGRNQRQQKSKTCSC